MPFNASVRQIVQALITRLRISPRLTYRIDAGAHLPGNRLNYATVVIAGDILGYVVWVLLSKIPMCSCAAVWDFERLGTLAKHDFLHLKKI